MTDRFERGFGTRCVHSGEAPDPTTGAHGVPLYQNVTYAFHNAGELDAMRDGHRPHFVYSPGGNPTVRCLEVKLADLDGAEDAVATSSGMVAISTTLLHLLAGGGHLIASADAYELARDFMCQDLPDIGATVSMVDTTDPETVAAAMTPATRAIYAETFSNPTLRVADLDALGAIAEAHGIPLVVDNTFLSPALCQPLRHGATLVIHSATKYLSGHGQTQGGVVCGPRTLVNAIRAKMIRHGGAMTPFAAWVLLAGVKTLPLRMERHGSNALRIATLLANHPAVASVNYPGLIDHPGHDVATRLLSDSARGYGGMVSFRPRDGVESIAPFLNALKVCTLAVSLGDCGTLVWPFHGTDLIRLSIGIEEPVDLEADLLRGLERLTMLAPAAD